MRRERGDVIYDILNADSTETDSEFTESEEDIMPLIGGQHIEDNNHNNIVRDSRSPLLLDEVKAQESNKDPDTKRYLLGFLCGVISAVGLAGSSICVQLLEGKLTFLYRKFTLLKGHLVSN